MDEFEKKIFQLKYEIRYAINKSGLPISVSKLAVQSILAELYQINFNEVMQSELTKGSDPSANIYEDNLGEQSGTID